MNLLRPLRRWGTLRCTPPPAGSPFTTRTLTDVTFRCMACCEERPGDAISVRHLPMTGLEDGFPADRANFRYCNDRCGCKRMAEALTSWP